MSLGLDPWREAGLIGALGLRLARTLGRLAGEPDEAVLLAAALAAEAPLFGDICLHFEDLEAQLAARAEGLAPPADTPAPAAWLARVARSPLVAPGGPLVLADGRLYLARYHQHQARLARAILERAHRTLTPADPAGLRTRLGQLFPDAGSAPDGCDRQQLAALVACLSPLTVITGGPGTGKTTTVIRLLALLLAEARAGQQPWPPRITLLAPTGKAAARMTESVRQQIPRLPVDDTLRAALPTTAATLHRALGARPDRIHLRHDAANPLTADIVVVDEASMIDLALMARLFDALRPGARLILLGDQDQLASVEPGAVLGDLCADGARFSAPAAARIARHLRPLPEALLDPARPPGLADCTVALTRTWRFDAGSAIEALAAAINRGDPAAALALLRDPAASDACLETPAAGDPLAALQERIIEGFRPLATARDPAGALAAQGAFRLLCAHRGGALGVRAVNQRVERWLTAAGLIRPDTPFYPGRPVMVLRNDYTVGLFNGDVGVAVATADGPRIVFPRADGGLRPIAPARLPPHETVYATTVHKSQGSEFDAVILVLPETPSPLITRELLYTGVTRARRQVHLLAPPAVLEAGITARVVRASGLRAALAAGA